MILEQRHQFGRMAVPFSLAAAAVLLALGAVVWVQQSRASINGTAGDTPAASAVAAAPSAPPFAAVAAPAAAPEEDARALERYGASCERAVRDRKFEQALSLCKEFTQTESVAAKAHTSMAVASMLRGDEPADLALSAKHAEMAAKRDDPMGMLIFALYGLNGNTAQALSPEAAQAMIDRSLKGGISQAQRLLSSLKEQEECRQQSKVVMFELPVFCMNRGQLRQALKATGLKEQDKPYGSDREVFTLGPLLPGARQMSLQYAGHPKSQLLTPAQLSYRFSARDAVALLAIQQRLVENLQKKYGKPARSDASGLGQWLSADGIEIELSHEGSSELLLNYRHPQRMLALQKQTQQQEQRRAEQLNAQILTAL